MNSLLKSISFALQGIFFCLKTQRNARLHMLAAIGVCGAGFFLGVTPADWRWIIACITLVWFAELVNTAFEYLCDLIHPSFHASVKRAKDIAAGAVLVCAGGAAAIGVLTFRPYL